MYMDVLPGMSMVHLHVWCPRNPEDAVDVLEQELPWVVSCHMVAGDSNKNLKKNSKYHHCCAISAAQA